MGQSMLSIKNLQASVQGTQILQGLNLEVNPGELHAIMGPNASGKSTLAHVLAGRDGYEVTGGEVTYQGRDLLSMAPEERAREGVFLDTGTKMIHIGRNTRSTIISKGISAGRAQNSYRGLVKILKGADNARNYTQCDSLLLSDKCGAHTFPYIEVKNPTAHVEHEASTSKIGEDQLFYCRQRGLSTEDAVSMIVNGFCKEVFKELPMEFAVEAQKLLGISLEGAVG